jgi:hypothetical protein
MTYAAVWIGLMCVHVTGMSSFKEMGKLPFSFEDLYIFANKCSCSFVLCGGQSCNKVKRGRVRWDHVNDRVAGIIGPTIFLAASCTANWRLSCYLLPSILIRFHTVDYGYWSSAIRHHTVTASHLLHLVFKASRHPPLLLIISVPSFLLCWVGFVCFHSNL